MLNFIKIWLCIFTASIILFSCGVDPKSKVDKVKNAVYDSAILSKEKKELVEEKNVYDVNHYKQGVWEIKKNREIKGFETYVNDTLNGSFKHIYINYPSIISGQYKKGLENGPIKYFDADGLNAVIYFKLGEKIWTGFVGDAIFPAPMKGFTIYCDSVFVMCPYENDTIWYTGLFINKKPKGIHRMYYKNGKLKFEYNYTTIKIKSFDETGKLISDKKDNGDWLTQ